MSKILIGAAAVLGGAYLYDRNVQPIFSKTTQQQAEASARQINQTLQSASKDARQLWSEAKLQLQQQLDAAQARVDDVLNQIAQSDTFKWISDELKDYKSDAKAYKYAVTDLLTPEDQKPYLTQLVHKYIDLVNKLGGPAPERHPLLVSEDMQRKAWLAALEKDNTNAENRLENLKLEGERLLNSWKSWGRATADDIKSEYYKGKRQLNRLLNRADEQIDAARDQAVYNYEQAKKNLDDVVRSADSLKLDAAKRSFQNAFQNLKSYGDDLVNEVNKKL